ncbi:cytochrome P450 [Streptomyces sp. NPDC006798]|uniref:cytochrome P450 n=1 Tax=Streptomyces sp. NPDC006798 TaxID=3155462 RepID=UPI0033EAAC8B
MPFRRGTCRRPGPGTADHPPGDTVSLSGRPRISNRPRIPTRTSAGSPRTPGRSRAPGALPLIGHAVSMLKDPYGFFGSLPAHGELVDIGIGPFKATVVTTAELTYEVLKDDRTFDKGGLIYERTREVLGDGVVTCPYKDHRRLRRVAQPAFGTVRQQAYTRLMSEQITRVTGAWTHGREIDILADMTTVAARTGVAAFFAGHLASPELSKTPGDLATVSDGVFRRMALPAPLDRIPTPGKRRYDRSRARLRGTIDAVIADYRRTGEDHGDLLSMLLATTGDKLTDTELNDAAITFFFGATDTIAITVSWALHRISTDPELERALHTEVDTVLAGRAADHDDLEHLTLTQRIITETLRMYPPIWIFTREVATDTELAGHLLRAGTNLVISPYVLHHSTATYADPERFDPSRWEGKALGRVRDHVENGIIPFGAGPRKCMGDVFAMNEITLALADIATHWRLRPVDPAAVRPAHGAILGPVGLRLRAEARPPAGS